MKLWLFIFGVLSAWSALGAQGAPEPAQVYQHSLGHRWTKTLEKTWVQSQGEWSRPWVLDQVKGGFLFITLESQGFCLAVPLAGGQGYICHRNQEIWLPYPGEFRAITPPETPAGKANGPSKLP